MARLLTAGAETNDATLEGFPALAIDTSHVRSGSRAFNVGSQRTGTFVGAAATTYYARAFMFFTAATASAVTVLAIRNSANGTSPGWGWIRLNADGTLSLMAGSTLVASSSALSLSTWYRVELAVKVGTGATDYCEGLLDGVSFGSTTTGNWTDNVPDQMLVAPDVSGVNTWMDDLALNDSTGANQNSWPGDGHVVLLLPTADSAVGAGWTNDAASASNIFNAVDNTPPGGIADTTSGNGLHQIRDATTGADEAYDATMTTYTAAGVPAGATINVIDPIVATGAPLVTSAKQGTVGMVSNPAITPIALAAAGVSGAFWQGNAAGTYPTGWKISHGTVTYAPAVTLGTAPVMRINQVTSSTRIAMCCFMGCYVDYTPAAPSLSPPFGQPGRRIQHMLVR
jgi:hypothetical protein